MPVLIGIDVGGTNLRIGVVKFNASHPSSNPIIIEEKRFMADFALLCKSDQQAPEQAWQTILYTISDAINSVRHQHPEVSAVGIGFPGFIDPNTQKILQSPNLPGLSHVDLTADLKRLIQLPVVTENDALAAAYGEYATRANVTNSLIYLGLGTGVGGGLVINGQPFQGKHGVAMEVGHIIVEPNGRICGCGNHGCMEQYASASAVSLSYFETTGLHCSAEEVAARATKGDQKAIDAYQLAGITLAKALAHILKVIDVGDVVLGGGMSAAWGLMSESFQRQLDRDLIPALRGKVNVSISSMGDQAGMIGAAMLAQSKLVS